MRTETQSDLDVRPDDAVTAGEQLPDLARLTSADEGQHDPHPASSLAGLAEPEHVADSSPVVVLAVERQVIELGDYYDPPTVELYPPPVADPPPVPDRDEPMWSARSILAREHWPIETRSLHAHTLGGGRSPVSAHGIETGTRVRITGWHWLILAAVLVPLALAITAVWANGVIAAEPVPHTPPPAPTTGPTPSPYGLSVTEHGAAFVAGLLGLHGGGAR